MTQLAFIADLIAILCSGLFTGAALYINLVEHPARMEAGLPLAVAEFRPSYRRATVMQVSLVVLGTLGSVVAWSGGAGASSLLAAIALIAVVPFTLVVIFPTNVAILDPGLDPASTKARDLLLRWGHLHAVRTLLGLTAFVLAVLSFAP